MTHGISRRHALRALGAAGALGLAGCTQGGGGGSADSMKIGVLQPLSGNVKYYGQQSLWGFLSGLAYKGDSSPPSDAGTGEIEMSVGDTTYTLYVRDTKFKSKAAQTAATDLVKNKDVDMLTGCSSSGAARRVINQVAKPSDVPIMVGPAASAGITSNSDICGDLVFRANENTAMDARSGGRYVANETDVSKVYLFGADYSFGKAVVNNYETVLTENGVEVVGKKFTERGYSKWSGLLDNAESAGAEGIVGGYTVVTLPKLFSAFLSGDYSYRVFGGFATQISNAAIGSTMQKVLGKPLTEEKVQAAQLGPFTSRYHWNQYDNEINNWLVENYTNAYGVVPDLFTSGTFTGASAIHQAVTEAGSKEAGDLTGALSGMSVTDTPKGKNGYTFQSYNNQARSAMTVADLVPTTDEWAENWKAAVQPSSPITKISGKKATIPKDDPGMNCSL